MKKYLITTTLFLGLIILKSDAQNALGIKGVSVSQISLQAAQNKTQLIQVIAPDWVLIFLFFINPEFQKFFLWKPSWNILLRVERKMGFQAFPNPIDSTGTQPYLYANYKSEAKLNYLMLSELAKFNWQLGKSHYSFYVDAGPFFGYLVSAHQVTSGTSDVYADDKMQVDITQLLGQSAQSFNNKEDIKDDLHKGNFGVEGDVGFVLNFTKSEIFIEGGANYGFINIQKGSDNGKNNTGAATVRIGYAFNFGKMNNNKDHS